jgi:glucan 1,3-beta-glucosidase
LLKCKIRNQQFTGTNLTFYNAQTAIRMNQDWIWAWRYVSINNCPIGIDMQQSGAGALGQVLLSDSVFNNVSQAIITNYNCSVSPVAGQTLIIHNVDFRGATKAISYPNGTVILAGGSVVADWMQGPVYSAYYGPRQFPTHGNETCFVPTANQVCIQGPVDSPPIPDVLKNPAGGIVDRAKPVYDDYPLSAFISAKSNGCAGDGITDDTACLQNIITNANINQVVYIDHGAYVISDTIFVPAGRKIMGEGWPKIMVLGASPTFSDRYNPKPAFQVGNPGDVGSVEMQDIVFETRGPAPGAIIVQWHLAEDAQASAGMDSIPRLLNFVS